MAKDKVEIKKYINNYTNPQIHLLDYGYTLSKPTTYKNETMNTLELVFESVEKEAYNIYDRVSIRSKYFNWHILNTNVKLKSKESNIYEHVYTLVELAHKLTKYQVSNLSFNNLILDINTQERVKLYANLFEVVKRINILTPFELKSNILSTRAITTIKENNDYLPVMTDKLYDLLINYIDVPEFNFTGRNLFECLAEIFSLVGGVPKLIENENGSSILDIELFNEDVDDVNIDDYIDFEENQTGNNYATEAEIRANNIVDTNSSYVQGLEMGNFLQSEQLLLDDQLLVFKFKVPIERLLKAYVYKIGDLTNKKDATKFIKNEREYKLLPIDRGNANTQTIQNCLQYKLGGMEITGFGNEAKKKIVIFDTIVFSNMLSDLGFTSITDLRDYGMIIEIIPYSNNNRIKAKSLSFKNRNKFSSININTGDRVNDFTKILRNTQNKLSRLSPKQITKKVKHKSFEDVYEIGAKDLDTGLYIAVVEVEETVNDITATYIEVEDLNIISEYVNVNSENRFTDAEANYDRQEIYEDWCLLTTDTSLLGTSGTDNQSSIKNDKVNLCFPIKENQESLYKYWLIPNKEAGDSVIAPPNISAGANTIVWKIPFNTPTFIGNEIADTIVDGNNKLIERGAPYTNIIGQLYKGSFVYGVDLKDNINPTKNELKTYPYSDNFLKPLQPGEERDYIFSIGASTIEKVETPTTYPDFTTSQVIEGSLFGCNQQEYTFDTLTINENDKLTNISFNMSIFPYSSVGIGGICRDDSISIKVIITSKFGFDLPVYERTFKPLTFRRTFPEGSYVDLYYYDEFSDLVDDDFIQQDLPINLNVNADITSIRIETKGYLGGLSFFREKSSFVYYKDVVYNIESENILDEDGLIIDKNPNERLGLQYQLNYGALSEDIILGEKLADNSRFLYDENDDNKYIRFETYASTLNKITKYNFTNLVGVLTNLSLTRLDTLDYLLIDVDRTNPLFDSLKSWSYVGVRLENGVEVRDFIFGVNRINGDLRDSVIIAYKHFHPFIVKDY